MCIVLLLLGLVLPKNNKVEAEALTMGTGMTLAALNPAFLPAALIGLAACLLIGYTVTNWDEIAAFGASVIKELKALGHNVSDFITGTSVKIDDTFKKAVINASTKTGDHIQSYNKDNTILHGRYQTYVGTTSTIGPRQVFGTGLDNRLFIGNVAKGQVYVGFFGIRYNASRDNILPAITVTLDVAPIADNSGVKLMFIHHDGGRFNIDTQVTKNSDGKIVQLSGTIDRSDAQYIGGSVFVDFKRGPITITKVTVPQVGIVDTGIVSTQNLKAGEITKADQEQYINTAFPTAETVTFRPDADVAGVDLVTLPNVSSKTYTGDQVANLTNIRARARVGTNTLVDAGAGATSTTAAQGGLNFDWLSKLWDWLKKLLDAILSLPTAILDGLKALWDWLSKILASIKAIPNTLSTAFTDALTWAFGVDGVWLQNRLGGLKTAFNAKLPSIQPLNYNFTDKDAFDDIRADLPIGGSQVIVSGAIMSKYAPPVKLFLRGLFYILLAMFFVRKFHKTAED